MNEYSIGYVADAADNGNYVTILTVPTGYVAKVSYFLAAATGTTTIDAKWSDGTDIVFLHAKNMSAGDLIEFGGDGKWLVMREGDSMQVKASSASVNVIASYILMRDI